MGKMVCTIAFANVNILNSIRLNKNNSLIKSSKNDFRNNNQEKLNSLKAMQTGAQNYDGVRIGPPPDLPSLLLHNRIVYMGMPLVPAVTELMVAELLYLQYENAEKPVFMYINSPGTSSPDGQNVGFETEAFAIADTMQYIKPEIQTICIGQAFGTAAMLLSNGVKGKRACLPNSTLMLHQPRSATRGQASDIAIKAREVLHNRQVLFTMIAERTGQEVEKVIADASRTKYLTAEDALEYGIVDSILQ